VIAEALETACADAWPAMAERRLGDWRLRAAGGFTGRANSALAVGDPGMPVPDALRETCAFAAEHDIAPKAQAVAGSPAESAIGNAGWTVDEPHSTPGGVLVLTAPLGALAGEFLAEAAIHDVPPPGWWPLVLSGATEPDPAARHVLASGERVGFGMITPDAAAVRGAIVRNPVTGETLLHIARLTVAEPYRRRGLARALLATLADWGLRNGASACVLQVASDNEGALALYRGLGCAVRYRYRYYRP
jgi:ribosomal protein S18 acetylase RimI-like enzyme